MPTLFRSAGIPLGFASLVVYAVYLSKPGSLAASPVAVQRERQVAHLQSAVEAPRPEGVGLLQRPAAAGEPAVDIRQMRAVGAVSTTETKETKETKEAKEMLQPASMIPLTRDDTARPAAPRSLADIGRGIGSDKIVVHQYHVPYDLHFAQFRSKPAFDLLEVGLGCLGLKDVGLGVRLWGEYFTHARMDVVEYDGACARKFAADPKKRGWIPERGAALHVGDQSDAAFLEQLAQFRGGWDVVIDDGSHEPAHQILTFRALFPHVRSGGKYSIEDLQTSFSPGRWGGEGTATHWVGTYLMRRVHTQPKSSDGEAEQLDSKFRSSVASVDCHHFVCIVTKR
ncbi:8-demethyl-8-(2-methoxy-alpha-L-rhamnosyl)-tetracenomycin-C 3prime-O-methyltransferase [Diplonema papillatum]|nr:8-demethyl-8-(2-methoxy-alpha-L-rhamnosyl)-tetracenomycin-C 3prime-O-methyltransferase [Diplonema papillatum]